MTVIFLECVYPSPYETIHIKWQALSSVKKKKKKKKKKKNYLVTLSALGKNFSRRHFEIFFLFFPENGLSQIMQNVSFRDTLHEMSEPIFWEKDYQFIIY